MGIGSFLVFLLLAVMVTLASYGFDRLYARILLPARFLYYGVRAPGIALHELAHIAGCLVTGAEIRRVVLFSREGGSVTYASPKVPVIGTVIINTAPLILLPLFLAFMTWVFPLVFGSSLAIALPMPGREATPYELVTAVGRLFYASLVMQFNGWFLLYLYLCTTITLSLAPSRQDLANGAAGMAILAAACILIFLSGFAPAISLLDRLLALMTYPFLLGLIFELIVAVVSLPLILIHGIMLGR